MQSSILIEGRCPVTRRSGHVATASADVCLTPQGPALVPVPYPNRAASSALRRGSRRVSCNKGSVMLETSRIAHSTGNEMGVGGGIKSKQTRGPCRAVQVSRRVQIEGRGVALDSAVTLQNDDNAIGRFGR